jgi:1-acyl-sn-glycerol-3-phosphate acyltransferase
MGYRSASCPLVVWRYHGLDLSLARHWHTELRQPLLQRLGRFPHQPSPLATAARLASAVLVRAWLRLCHRFTISGQENLPEKGSHVLVANHCSHLDTLCLTSALPLAKVRRVFPAAAKDYFFDSLPRLAAAMVVVNALPFDRFVHIRQSLSLCRQVLQEPGNVLIFFPEGTRSQTGELAEFRPGIGILLAEARCPVIPCHLRGTHEALPKGAWIPRPRPIHLTIGTSRDYSGRRRGKGRAAQIAEELHDVIRGMAADCTGAVR